jgi:arylsulfatase
MAQRRDGETFLGIAGRTLEDSTPWWPEPRRPPAGAPNVLIVVLDDVGYSDFGCYGSEIATPNIDALAASGLRYTGFHTTALCSPTRACLLTGRNHHSVGMGGLADWDHGFPGTRGRVNRSAGTLAEMLRARGYNTCAIGKWHLTPMAETSAVGPFDQWPTQRGFDRYYGFLGGETNQIHPELVCDNHPIETPDRPGYHLTEDLVDRAIDYLRNQSALAPDRPFLLYLALGACHAPHQAPREYVERWEPVFEKGWDTTREERIARQLAMGIVPQGTELPPRNDRVRAWDELSPDERRLAVRLQAAYAGMLEHADVHLGRLFASLEPLGRRDDTLIVLLSDNGASQEGAPLGTVNAARYFNAVRDDLAYNLEHIDQIGEAHLNNNYPQGWAMAGNTPFKRYKQNTHGGGVRDPLIVSWPARIAERGALRSSFCHVTDLAPTILELAGIEAPAEIAGVAQQPIEGRSLAATMTPASSPRGESTSDAGRARSESRAQYFEMLGHRGIWHDGWKAVSWHKPYTSFDQDRWELYHLDEDWSETRDLAAKEPRRLAEMIERWWIEAGRHQVLPLREGTVALWSAGGNPYGNRARTRFVLYGGMERLSTDAAPDIRNRSYSITAAVEIPAGGAEGVLVAHGDWCSGYALYVKDGRLVHDYNFVGTHHVVRSDLRVEPGRRTLRWEMQRTGEFAGAGTLSIDGKPCGRIDIPRTHGGLVSFIGFEVGRAPLPAVSDFAAPFPFTGTIEHVTFELDEDQVVDRVAEAGAAMQRQ